MRIHVLLAASFVLAIVCLMTAVPNVSADAARQSTEEKPMRIGTRKQLFVDDYVVAKRTNVMRELGQAAKANDGKPIIVPDKPWENDAYPLVEAVFRDGGKFRLWYRMSGEHRGYAESEDGLRWTKPNLGLFEYQGSKDNNIVDSKGGICFLDPHETDPQHKYKAAYCHDKVMAALAHSPDGFHWTSYNNGEPVTGRAGDTFNQLLWDEDAKTYRLYTRTDYGKGIYAGTLNENRGTRDMVNPDIKKDPTAWKTVREWQFNREGPWEFKRRQVYSLNDWIYEGVQFGLLWSYEWAGQLGEGPYDLEKRHECDIMNFYIVTARGDEMWDLSWVYAEKPLIPRGPDGSFDKDWVQPATNIITWNDKHWIYYSGARERHGSPQSRKCSIGLATLRLDGFVCLEARDDTGTVITKPFELEGENIEVNVDAKGGEVQVEVLDASGKPIPGFSGKDSKVYRAVDELRLQPKWRDSLAVLKGQVVQLRFSLKNAKLYAFQVKP
ncbi:MAG: hypothetical protein A2Z18_03340 [Armatimonadetes bacterium RBG_16_58_9]|nr:MAG: hypothetical protein A2Z18_03340 [Armatimonadetes bacterium RBG_16_58_9]